MISPQVQIEALEAQRLAAISSADVTTMERLLADDYVHVNSTGRVNDKAGFLKSMTGRARETQRGPLDIRVYGDSAVIIGEQTNRTGKADGPVTVVAYVATQVAQRTAGEWRFTLMQLTQKASTP